MWEHTCPLSPTGNVARLSTETHFQISNNSHAVKKNCLGVFPNDTNTWWTWLNLYWKLSLWLLRVVSEQHEQVHTVWRFCDPNPTINAMGYTNKLALPIQTVKRTFCPSSSSHYKWIIPGPSRVLFEQFIKLYWLPHGILSAARANIWYAATNCSHHSS